MRQKKINQLKAAKTTIEYCEKTAAETASIASFAPKVASIKGRIAVAEGFVQHSATPVKGVTVNVNGIRASVIESVMPLGSAMFAYGAMLPRRDEILMAKAKLTRSYLEDIAKEKCGTECQRIVTLAVANAANILPLGIDATMLNNAQAAVTLFMNVISHPRAAIISRAGAGQQAEEILKEIMNDDLAKQLDVMASILRFSKAEWWRGYDMSRAVIKLGTTHTKLRATCKDASGHAMKGVTITLQQEGVVVYRKKTDAEGKVSMRVKPGNYDILFEMKGFESQRESDFHFAPGSEKIHHVVMNPQTPFPK
jgi:hypothetical protein